MLTESQNIKLSALANDQELMDGLRTFFADEMRALPNLSLSNEEIGANFRAREEAKRLVDAAFRKLMSLNNHPTITKLNPAR